MSGMNNGYELSAYGMGYVGLYTESLLIPGRESHGTGDTSGHGIFMGRCIACLLFQ